VSGYINPDLEEAEVGSSDLIIFGRLKEHFQNSPSELQAMNFFRSKDPFFFEIRQNYEMTVRLVGRHLLQIEDSLGKDSARQSLKSFTAFFEFWNIELIKLKK
jgi:hypothetical protein